MKAVKYIIITLLLTVFAAGALTPAALSGEQKEKAEKPAFDFNKNILISIFWPPTSEYINDEQYKYMADAEIDWVLGTGDGIGSKEDQLKMLELCSKYGIGMCVGDNRFGNRLLNYKPDKIKKLVEEYKDVPGAYGYYMLDEPYNANVFIDAYSALKEADPNGYMHLNFLPGHAYPSYEIYESQINDWLRLCAETGYPQEYVMYDMYPFMLSKDSINRTLMMKNLDSVRKTGLLNNVKTGMYIQSVSQTQAFRSPNREETLFEFNIGLAYGIKQFSYFTWFTPYNREAPFADGIITHKGVPNKKYEFICEIDKMMHNVGKTLINLDALEVYESANTYDAAELIPDDFFVHTKGKSDLTISYLKDKHTGRNYCMAVNNLFTRSQSVSLVFSDDIGALQYLSYEDGELYDLAKDGNTVNAELDKGEAVIIALPEGYDYSEKHVKTYAPSDNLASDAVISCSSSVGAEGWYMDNLNDGRRFAATGANGWRSSSKNGLDTITVDLRQTQKFNRIDLYPAGVGDHYGASMPSGFTVSYSDDGDNWRVIATAKDLTIHDNSAPSLRFDRIYGRYVKIEISECNNNRSELCEIEIYNDDETLPGTELYKYGVSNIELDTDPVVYKKNSNIALGKAVYVSSYPESPDYKTWGWAPEFLTDGNLNNGWTSNVQVHKDDENSTEYAIVDLGDEFCIEKAEIYPNGCWPKDFTVSVSSDGKTFTDIASETNDINRHNKGISYTVEPENAVGRFIMMRAVKLRKTSVDGYMLQLAEIKVYGTPYLDKDGARADMELFVNSGGDTESGVYKAVLEALDDELMTQKKLDVLIGAMLKEVNVEKQTETEAETEAATAIEYDFDYSLFEGSETTVEITTTEAATEKETEKTDETKPAATDTVTETTKDNNKENGTKTAIIAVAVIAIAAVITGVIIFSVIKKKKQTR